MQLGVGIGHPGYDHRNHGYLVCSSLTCSLIIGFA